MKNFPYLVSFEVPGFLTTHPSSSIKLLSPVEGEPGKWFDQVFFDATNSIGKKFYPILRLSDGEYQALFGRRSWNSEDRITTNILRLAQHFRDWLRRGRGIYAFTEGVYSSGVYDGHEVQAIRKALTDSIMLAFSKGRVALHLNVIPGRPFCEQYFKDIDSLIDQLSLKFGADNYCPFYFVYAMLLGPYANRLYSARSILVVHSATGEKQSRITASLLRLGAARVRWVTISKDRSCFDVLSLSDLDLSMEICLVGGGLGKGNLIPQLAGFKGPVIDAGYVLECYADERLKFCRVYCASDTEWLERGVNNVFDLNI
ncbi:MAG: hypothetical protein FJ184_01275 [Gammaproteobacteria bacterium]|nr:hypothetical protein [Gammaproteobacteria bacterium]